MRTSRVPLVAPTVQTSPPIGSPQLVGFPTWLWIDPAAWGTFDATATVPGLTVTVTATPKQVEWDMGDGNHVTCDGPGTPWVEGTSAAADTDCEYTYQFTSADQPGGTYTVTATVTWAVTWDGHGRHHRRRHPRRRHPHRHRRPRRHRTPGRHLPRRLTHGAPGRSGGAYEQDGHQRRQNSDARRGP